MRAVIVGAGALGLRTAATLAERGHEVVIVERDAERIASAGEEIDCGFLKGDGTHPSVLREAGPDATDVLLCLTSNDQSNIIATLVGRSLGFPRVITRIEDMAFDHICLELGLRDTVIPVRTVGRHLADIVEGGLGLEASEVMRRGARWFVFVAGEDDARRIDELELPAKARVTHLYRDGEFMVARDDLKLRPGDEVVVVSDRDHVAALAERWPAASTGSG